MLSIKDVAIKKLIEDYDALQNPKPTTMNKYRGNYNDVHINIYFDSWDKSNYNFQMILIYKTHYYLMNLRIVDEKVTTHYLPDLPSPIYSKIIKDETLRDFYDQVENIIVSNKSIPINIERDVLYSNTIRYNPPAEEMFLKGLTHKNMQDSMMEWIEQNTNLKKRDIDKVRNANMTFVRTADITKRKKIEVILRNHNII